MSAPVQAPQPDPASIVDDVRSWCQVSGALTDTQLIQIITAEQSLQATYCRWGEAYPAELGQSVYRRVAREVSARGVPLGLAGLDSEMGPQRMPAYDPEIERLESPYRKIAVA